MKNKEYENKFKYQKGIALVEVIAALGVAVVAITALVSLSISTLRTSLDSKLLLEGTKVANREIELVRAYRDGESAEDVPRSWESFIDDVRDCTLIGLPCHIDSGVVYSSKGVQNSGKPEEVEWFFTVTDPDTADSINPSGYYPPIVRISVTVNWTIGDQQKGSYVYTDLSNWRGR